MDSLWDHRPEGFCRLVIPEHNIWHVKGRENVYTCNADRNESSCLDYLHRHAVARTACKHLLALERWLTLTPCPCCKEEGKGCMACAGLGRVTAEEHAAIEEAGLAPLPDEGELREVFR